MIIHLKFPLKQNIFKFIHKKVIPSIQLNLILDEWNIL